MALAALILTSSCASIVSKSEYPIAINSTPSEAKITVTNKKGIVVYEGNTPSNIYLKSGAGFFSKAAYTVKFEKDGYDARTVPVEFKVDGWYWGNLVFGGLLGFLIIDPATGAMYKLKTEFLNETLSKSTADVHSPKLEVYSINDIPVEWKNNLVLIQK